jgi:uncharacterized protein (TIGR03435 family)
MTTPNAQSPTPTLRKIVQRFATSVLVSVVAAGGYAQNPASVKFEVSSVRANTSNAPMQALPTLQPSGRVFAINLPLRELIQAAYGLRDNQLIISSQMADAQFDLEARAGASATRDQAIAMLRTLLVERFNLKAHPETRELPVYSLVRVNADRLGPQLKAAGPECASLTFPTGPGLPPPPPPPPPAMAGTPLIANRMLARCPTMFFPGGMSVRGMDMVAFGLALERFVRRPVYDKTGLQGAFDFDLTYTPDTPDSPVGPGIAGGAAGGPPPAGSAPQDGPSLFDALRSQLGLRLESGRAPVDVLVVDQVQPPTAN